MEQRRLSMVVVVAAAAGLARAGSEVQPLLLEGDAVTGVGSVTRIDNLAVNDSGGWIIEADTNNADTDADSVLVKNGELFLREGDALDEPAGSTIGGFDSVNLNNSGDSGWNLFLDDTGSSSTDSGLFINDQLLLQEGFISTADGFNFPTPYIGFFETKYNDAGQLFVVASVDDPLIVSSVDRALVIISEIETVILKEGNVLPGQFEGIEDFGTDSDEFDFTDGGDSIFIADLTGDTSTDLAIYTNIDGVNTFIAQEGDASPVSGRNWQSFSSATVALNNAGDVAYRGDLDGDSATDNAIILNGELFAQEGDASPGGPPIENFGSSPHLDDEGNVLWIARWNGNDDEALLLNDQVLVQTGVTAVGEAVIDDLATGDDAFFISDNGRYVIFEATLDDGREGAFLLDLGAGDCFADCNEDGELNILDFTCFQAAFVASDPEADCNEDGMLNILDFTCFQAAFVAGCG